MLELALQVAAPLVRAAMSRRDGAPDPDSALTILCVGDSNTFGLNVPKPWSYPARLEARLQGGYDAPVSVVNRGVPGRNAAQMADALRDDLLEIDPDIVILLAGVNDTWNAQGESSGFGDLIGKLKLVRLVRVVVAGVTNPEPFDVATDDEGRFFVRRGDDTTLVDPNVDSGFVRSGADLTRSVQTWLTAAVASAREQGAEPVLMTYPEFQGSHGVVNGTIRDLAATLDVTLIDLERTFTGHFEREGYPVIMFNDHHPNLRGYELLADDVAAGLRAAGLAAAGRSGSASVSIPTRPPQLRTSRGGRLDLSGPPGWAFQVLLSRQYEPGQAPLKVGSVEIPVAEDDVLAQTRVLPEFSGTLDDEGQAVLFVPKFLRRQAPQTGLRACLLLLHAPDDAGAETPIAGVSDAVTVVL